MQKYNQHPTLSGGSMVERLARMLEVRVGIPTATELLSRLDS